MVPFYPFEQVNADFLELVSPYAGQRLRTDRIEIAIDELVGEGPHGQLCGLHVAEHNTLVAHDCDRGMQRMAAACQRLQLVAGRAAVWRLVKASLPECECLIGSDNDPPRPLRPCGLGLCLCQ